jgi:hypothetical protein
MKSLLVRLGIAGISLLAVAALSSSAWAEVQYPNLTEKKLEIKRGFTKDAADCIECHAKKTSGIVEAWKLSKMAHAAVSCYDCHVVKRNAPTAIQCKGLKGTKTYISPLVSSKTCSRCHPTETDQFLKSAHAKMASKPLLEVEKFQGLMYMNEGAEFLGNKRGSPSNRAARASGCQMCHGTQVEVGPDNVPINETWPGGVGTRYPDGSVGNCTVCHTRHQFSITEARKPEACASCHLGPDHPDIEIYLESKHGQIYQTLGEDWNWDSAPDAWEPGDYTAPTCATCHMSGIGELSTTHNVADRLKWDLVHKKSVIRSGERGDGEKGDQKMRKVCANCHGKTHTEVQRRTLDNVVELYNLYYDKAEVMRKDLKAKGLLKKDVWKDGFMELHYYLWHHTGRRARQGTAMNGPDYAHWHGFFQIFQVYKDMEDIYNYRIKNKKIEELSTVMDSAPD